MYTTVDDVQVFIPFICLCPSLLIHPSVNFFTLLFIQSVSMSVCRSV